MQRNPRNLLIYLLFLAFGGLVSAYVFSRQDLEEMLVLIRATRWEYVVASLLLTLGGHWVRALRWRQLLAGAGAETKTLPAFWALMNGYLVNLGIPRLGEITRCASLNRLSGVPVVKAAGSVVAERVIDLLCLFLILLVTFWTAQGELRRFYEQDIWVPLEEKVAGARTLIWAAGLVLMLGLIGFILFLRYQPRQTWLQKLKHFARQMADGLVGIFRMQRKGLFLAYTILIWASYFSAPLLMLYALDLAPGNRWQVGLVAFAVGSIARTVPAPAGSMGPYHWLVSRSLLLFGLTEAQGLALATLNHAVQTLFYLVVGGASFLGWAWTGRKSS